MPMSPYLARFQKAAHQVIEIEHETSARRRSRRHSSIPTDGHRRSQLAVAQRRRSSAKGSHHSHIHGSNSNEHFHEREESSGGDISSGELSDGGEIHGADGRKGLVYQKRENIYTRIRDMIAQSDVFIARSENPPFVACLTVSIYFVPILGTFCLWDTLAIVAFQLPRLCGLTHPGFLLCWISVMLLLAMYGFMLSYLSTGNSQRTRLAAICLGYYFFLLFYRIFFETFFDGFRGQSKLYFEISKRSWY